MGNHRRKRRHGKKSTAQYLYEQMGGEGECVVVSRHNQSKTNAKVHYEAVEGGGRVATNVHHRRSKHTGGSNNQSNLSRVPIKAHNEYNRLFRDGHMHPTEMAKVLTEKWIDPDWEMVARRKGCTTEEIIGVAQPKHDCTKCPNHQLRQTLNPILAQMAQAALAKAFEGGTA